MHPVAPSRFWQLADVAHSNAVACTDGGVCTLTYGELALCVQLLSDRLAAIGPRHLGFVLCTNTPDWLLIYLACLNSGHVPLLLPDDLSQDLMASLQATYSPAWTWRHMPEHPQADVVDLALAGLMLHEPRAAHKLHPELGLLLSTSGSTGSPKLVRLSYDALGANACSIRSYLDLMDSDRALTTLPCSYSYGLSVVNSHLAARGSLVLKNVSLISRDFLQIVREQQITSLAGVPTWYQMLLRTGLDKGDTPSIRTFTQDGGRLDERTKRAVLAMAKKKSARFFVMYGQTEATARISYVPAEALEDHMDAIGVAIPGGRLSLDPQSSEIIYEGRNVMMGYAEQLSDLAKADECQGVLRTGDLGEIDANGFFRITGRLKRFIKLSGARYGLDEIESQLSALLDVPLAVAGRDERLGIWIETEDDALIPVVKAHIQSLYQLHHSLFRIQRTNELPLLSTGKKDYGALLAQLG